MDDQNKSLNDRWAEPGVVPERGYAVDATPTSHPTEEPPTRRTAEIRSEIEQTRADMTDTIDAIQDKLRPSNIVSNAKDTVRDATVGKVKSMATTARERFAGDRREWRGDGNGVMDRIRENPVPAAIAAASIAWIAFSGRRSAPRTSPAIYGSTRDGEAFVYETVISTDVDEATELGPYGAGSGYEARRSAREAAGEVTERAQSMVRGTGTRVRRATSDAGTRVQRFVRSNPLAAGAIAAAVGATVGMALPETRRENELMGEARDTVVTRAQDAARDAAEKVQDAAERVGSVAGEAARSVKSDR
jgi:ElaB/YqjD/DUF883 family membrane-anchored ribosome-binding protein